MAGDVLALMRRLGHEQFAVVGHDRGSYVGLLALDVPQAVIHLLPPVPIRIPASAPGRAKLPEAPGGGRTGRGSGVDLSPPAANRAGLRVQEAGAGRREQAAPAAGCTSSSAGAAPWGRARWGISDGARRCTGCLSPEGLVG